VSSTRPWQRREEMSPQHRGEPPNAEAADFHDAGY
jgi:hypothetical protein